MIEPGLQVRELNLWRGENWLVRNLSFSAQGGELIHVLGPNGSGKTTLLRALAGLTLPESGEISWCGTPLFDDLLAWHRQLAWIGHRDGLKPELTAAENLRTYRRLGADDGVDFDAALEEAGLAACAGLPVRVLSAGQKRRAALTRVFSSSAPVWILDEPFANLDTAGQRWGVRQLERHVGSGGVGVVTTHLAFEPGKVRRIELGGS